MSRDEWVAEAAKRLIEHYSFTKAEADHLADIIADDFMDDYNPDEAVDEEMSCWGD